MTVIEVLIRAGETQEFPMVCVNEPVVNHPNISGRITQIRPNGVSVNLGLKFDKWFWFDKKHDARSTFMSELTFL